MTDDKLQNRVLTDDKLLILLHPFRKTIRKTINPESKIQLLIRKNFVINVAYVAR